MATPIAYSPTSSTMPTAHNMPLEAKFDASTAPSQAASIHHEHKPESTVPLSPHEVTMSDSAYIDDDMFESDIRTSSQGTPLASFQLVKDNSPTDPAAVPRTPIKPNGALLQALGSVSDARMLGDNSTAASTIFAANDHLKDNEAASTSHTFGTDLTGSLSSNKVASLASKLLLNSAETNEAAKESTTPPANPASGSESDEPMASLRIRLAPKPKQTIVEPPNLGDTFISREAFKAACQHHAVSVSSATPENAFHFSTRTSSVGKWLVFSCHAHIRGCPVAVRAEKCRESEDWMVTSTCYTHNHFSALPAKASRKLTVVKKKSKAAEFCESGEKKSMSSKSAKAYRPRQPQRSFSFNVDSAKAIKRRASDPATQIAIRTFHNRKLERLAAGPAAPPGDSLTGNGSPRFKSEREYGRSRQHSMSDIRQMEDVTERLQINSEEEGEALGLLSHFGAITNPTNPFNTNALENLVVPNCLTTGTCIASRSPTELSDIDMDAEEPNVNLGNFLKSLHPSLAGMIIPLSKMGIDTVKTLLSLDQAELDSLADSIPEEETLPLQRLLLKSRVGRHLA